mmetsp:Transcript_11398/g.51607  ORF Transcript_11398/g.51607 Transcript_11398/m.51607 type:complete len:245 (-) Transcript_11398:2320-3054(-)
MATPTMIGERREHARSAAAAPRRSADAAAGSVTAGSDPPGVPSAAAYGWVPPRAPPSPAAATRISAKPRQISPPFSSGTTSGTGCSSSVSGSAAAVVDRHAATNWHAAARTAGASVASSATRAPAPGASGHVVANSAHVNLASGPAALASSLHALALRCARWSRASHASQNAAPVDAHALDQASPGAASHTAFKASKPASASAPHREPSDPAVSSAIRLRALGSVTPGRYEPTGSIEPMRTVQQ